MISYEQISRARLRHFDPMRYFCNPYCSAHCGYCSIEIWQAEIGYVAFTGEVTITERKIRDARRNFYHVENIISVSTLDVFD